MAIVSRPATKAYRDNWPFEEKREPRETRSDSDASVADLAMQLIAVVLRETYTSDVAFLKSIKVEGADK